MQETDVQRRAREALEASRTDEAERQADLQRRTDDAAARLTAQREARKAAEAEAQRKQQDAREARERERREAEAARLKAQYRHNYPGTDAEFEAAWPTIAAGLAAQRTPRRVTTL